MCPPCQAKTKALAFAIAGWLVLWKLQTLLHCAAASKPPVIADAPARPQRASALAATKRVTDFAAKQKKEMEVWC